MPFRYVGKIFAQNSSFLKKRSQKRVCQKATAKQRLFAKQYLFLQTFCTSKPAYKQTHFKRAQKHALFALFA